MRCPRDWDAEDLVHIDRRELELVLFRIIGLFNCKQAEGQVYSLKSMLMLIHSFPDLLQS